MTSSWDADDPRAAMAQDGVDIDDARENVLQDWPSPQVAEPSGQPSSPEPRPSSDAVLAPDPPAPAPAVEESDAPFPESVSEHAPGALRIPDGYGVIEGDVDGRRRSVGVVVSRFNGEVTTRLLAGALEELEVAGVAREAITIMPVPGAFELPLAAMALAKTRRFACVVALGCVIRGETSHFDFVSAEAASGIQLAALETGFPVSFGLLTLERADQAEARIDKGADAVRTALEMADAFANLRAAAAAR